MKIAVTYENGNIFQHFGKTEQFKIFDVNGKTVDDGKIIGTNGNGHGALAGFLAENGIDAVICGGIGAGAINALADAGVTVYAGVSGSADEAVKKLAEGTLQYSSVAGCDHHHDEGEGCHHHDEGHDCGETKGGCKGNH